MAALASEFAVARDFAAPVVALGEADAYAVAKCGGDHFHLGTGAAG